MRGDDRPWKELLNDIKFHPKHGTMATVGSDGTFSLWNNATRKKLNTSLLMPQPVTSCCFSHDGQIFAYSVGYDWAKGVDGFNNPGEKKSCIFLRPCIEVIQLYNILKFRYLILEFLFYTFRKWNLTNRSWWVQVLEKKKIRYKRLYM